MKQTRKTTQWTINNPVLSGYGTGFRPNTKNLANFPAFTTTVEERALQCAMTGGTANTFYMSSDENINGMISAFDALNDIELFKKILVYARTEGFTRSAPICGLAVLSKKDIKAFREVAPLVLKNPKDYSSFIDLCRSKSIRNGLGRGLKDVLRSAVDGLSEYHALKYPKNCIDMINVSHAKPTKITTYLKTGTSDSELKQLEAYEKLKRCETVEEAVELIKNGSLPFETVTAQIGRFKDSPEVWTALLHVAPYTNLLRNLNTFERHGVFKNQENLDYVRNRLCDKKAIEKSMVYPFQFYIALRNRSGENLTNGMREILETCLKLSMSNVPTITKEKIAIASDVSGSMSSNVLGDKSVLQCIDIVNVFTAVLYDKCENAPIVIPFSYDVEEQWMGRNYDNISFMDRVELFTPTGGTSLSAPVDYLLSNKIFVDKVIAFTDNMEWVGSSFITKFEEYKAFINPNAKAVLVTLMPYSARPSPPEYKDVTFVYGWSDRVLDVVTRDRSNQLEKVKNLDLESMKPKGKV